MIELWMVIAVALFFYVDRKVISIVNKWIMLNNTKALLKLNKEHARLVAVLEEEEKEKVATADGDAALIRQHRKRMLNFVEQLIDRKIVCIEMNYKEWGVKMQTSTERRAETADVAPMCSCH